MHLALALLLRGNRLGLVHAGQVEVALALSRRDLRRQPLLPHRLLVCCRKYCRAQTVLQLHKYASKTQKGTCPCRVPSVWQPLCGAPMHSVSWRSR